MLLVGELMKMGKNTFVLRAFVGLLTLNTVADTNRCN